MSDKLAKKICKCMEKEKITTIEDMTPCFEKVLVDNLKEIYKVYKIKSLEEFNFDKLGIQIGTKLMKECDYILENLTPNENKFEKDFVPEQNLDCSKLKSGEFYYLTTLNEITKAKDTTFVTIKENMFLERMNGGRNYSMLDINWIDDCKFELIFKDSNDPIKSVMSEPGEKYNYEMVSSTPNSYILKLFWRKKEYKIELFRTK
jgi:hypothetical protein